MPFVLYWKLHRELYWLNSNDTELYLWNGFVQWHGFGYELYTDSFGQLNQRHSSSGQQRGAISTELLGVWDYADHLSGSV